MRTLLAALAALVVFTAAAPLAHADPAACPPGVAATTGTNPSYAAISAMLTDSAAAHDVPVAVLKAIAYQESVWRQFDADGHVVVSSAATDGVCGLGMMQITADDRDDAARLASDTAYNIDEGAKILAGKFLVGQTSPEGYGPDDRDVIENWYYAICLYNGCPGMDDAPYAIPVAQRIADPFRRVTDAIRPYMPPAGFTLPIEANPAYDFPAAFQAQYTPTQQFVFYDATTKVVTSTVPKRTHHEAHPPSTAYPSTALGPDAPGVTCTVCGGWRLAEGEGLVGRAHWTLSQGTEGTRVTWKPVLPRTGRYLVSAYVPSLGTDDEPLGVATYHLGGLTVAVNQATSQDSWVPLRELTLSPGATVWLNDVADMAGRRIAADALRFVPAPTLTLPASASTVTYGDTTTLTATLLHGGAPLAGRPVKLYRRNLGTTAWTMLGTWTTGADGRARVTTKPPRNSEYTARFAATPGETAAASGDRWVKVRTRVTASISRTSVPEGTSVTVTGRVAPSKTGQNAWLQRYRDGGWYPSKSLPLDGSSTVSFTVAKPRGTYLYRVCKPPDGAHLEGCSGKLTLTVT